MALKDLFGNTMFSSEDGSKIGYLLRAILDKLPYVDPATAGARVSVQGTVPVSGTLAGVTTVTTVNGVTTITTLTNVTSIGGLLANADQYVQLQAPAASLRSRITVS